MDYNQQKENELYLSLGSNIGDRKLNLNRAIDYLKENFNCSIQTSSIYQSTAWGFESDSSFLNMCVKIETTFPPTKILQKTQSIENKMGRIRDESGKYIDRIIDIDLLFYGNRQINTKKIKIPHPLIYDRKFVLIPLLEIAPNLMDPNTRRGLGALNKLSNDKSKVILYSN
ncbi:MAG: 2-amino-4-hydroxy-6-hydroxymethyldihydropteridine diphosphokinase [Brumimicrobium sp.]